MLDLSLSPVLIWFLLGLVFYGIELALPGFVIFFFGIGAWCAALAIYFFDLSLTGQLVVFLVCSLLFLGALRTWLKKVFYGDVKEETDSVVVDTVPSTATVTEAILPPAEGRVKYAGSFWRATADNEIASGTVVEIVEKQDLLVKVRPVT